MQKENTTVRFGLAGINTDQFAIIEKNYVNDEIVNLNMGLHFGANKEQKTILVRMTFQFEQSSNPFLIVGATCHFGIEPTDWESFVVGSEIIVPSGFMTHLVAFTVGTARGILHAKTGGTNFNGFVIPATDVSDLVKDDVRL